jgi:hypothetical protein
MDVSCIICKKLQNPNDCWCCIDRGKFHYECKSNPECDAIRRAQEEDKRRAERKQWVTKKEMIDNAEKYRKQKKEEEEKSRKQELHREKKKREKKQKEIELTKTDEKKEDEIIRNAELTESAEAIDWEPTHRPSGFFQKMISFFYTEPLYTKVKTN